VPSDRIKALNAAIRESLQPPLLERSFHYEASTRTFRKAVGECTQIVNVQVGLRSLEGRFTVNLAIFHPEYRPGSDRGALPRAPEECDCWERTRLGMLRDTLVSKLLGRKFGDDANFLLWRLTTPTDKWWPFTPSEAENRRRLESVKALLFERGLNWLEAKSDVSALRNTHEMKTRRRSGV
jgi:hypothetical protein